MGNDLPKGYTCECGNFHEFPMYYYAHWYEELIHTCEKCGRKNLLCEGEYLEVVEDDEFDELHQTEA